MSHEVESLGESPEIIIALGKNWNRARIKAHKGKGIAEEMFLSEESKMNAHAAAETYRKESRKLPAYIVCTGGSTSKTPNFPSEGEAMKRYILRRYKDIPEDRILVEGESLDTWKNAKGTKAILQEKFGIEAMRDAILCTVGFHGGRSKTIFRRSGFSDPQLIASEEIIRDRKQVRSEKESTKRKNHPEYPEDPSRPGHYEHLVQKFKDSYRWKINKLFEIAYGGVITLDRMGWIPQITSLVRKTPKTK